MDKYTTYSDTQLIKGIRQGDRKCFDALFNRYFDRCFSFVYSHLPDREISKDIIQNVFMKMWLGRERLDHRQSIANYLLVSLRNEIISFLRLKHNSARAESEKTVEPEDPSSDTFSNLIDKENERIFRELVSQLPERRRQVLLMRYLDNKSAAEIAEALKLSVRTVERHLFLAMKDVRRIKS